MPFSGILRRVALVRTEVSEERIAPLIRVTGIGELGTLAVTSNRSALNQLFLVIANVVPSSPVLHIDDRGRNVGSYKSHTA
jgi:hypothetical protein